MAMSVTEEWKGQAAIVCANSIDLRVPRVYSELLLWFIGAS
jgi:hypothetical protein